MPVDKNATQYKYGNGRFDLMTDEEVRTLSGDEISAIVIRLAESMRHGETLIGQELYHHLYELWIRYGEMVDFRLEVVKTDEPEPEGGSS